MLKGLHTMSSHNIDILKKLAGIANNSAKLPANAKSTILLESKKIDDDKDELDEWANSVTPGDNGRIVDLPTGDLPEYSLRRSIGAKAMPTQIEDSDSLNAILKKLSKLDKSKDSLDEGFIKTSAVAALLGLASFGTYALTAKSINNSPLAQALKDAANSGDEFAKTHLDKLPAYVDTNSPMLRTLNQQYLKETIDIDTLKEEFRRFSK